MDTGDRQSGRGPAWGASCRAAVAPRSALASATALLAAVWILTGLPQEARAEAQAAQKPPLTIPIFLSSRKDLCFDPGDVAAIRRLATQEQDRINRQGGAAGRQVLVRFLDDARSEPAVIDNMRKAIADPSTLAMIGIANSARAKAAFDALGPELAASRIPFISDLSVTSLFEKFPNVFTTRSSQEDERLPVLAEVVKQLDARRPAFLGLRGTVFSEALGDGLKRVIGGSLVADLRLRLKDDKLDPKDIEAAVGELKAKGADFLVLNVGGARNALVLKQLAEAGIAPPVMVSGRLDTIPSEVASAYPNDLYQLAWDGLPDVYSDRLRKLIARSAPFEWVFEGAKVPEAPGWKSGECKPRPETTTPDPLTRDNLRAIGAGTQYADMVALIAAAAKSADPKLDIAELRAHVLAELKTAYATGRGTFQGSFENWSFQPKSRAAARMPLVIMRARGLASVQLAPFQFVRLKGDKLRLVHTLYVDVDLIRTQRVDDNEKTFLAEFYLSLRDNRGASIDQIEFTNAVLDPRTNDRQLTVRVLHAGGRNDAYPDNMKVYRVTGKFLFEPQLASYPFDTQRFAIDIQPKRDDTPFIIQPPPAHLRDKNVTTDGWDPKDQFVSYDEDFVPVINAQTQEPSIVPFYKASFVWMMKRQTTDYFLRVVVPLGFILLVAYLSVFIPLAHFEAIITLQVTALLSAVALYISLPKLDADTATLSDRIFLFDYMSVSIMIAISILRMSGLAGKRRWLRQSLGLAQMLLIPALVVAMAIYVYKASIGEA